MKGIGILLMMVGHVYYGYIPKLSQLIYTFHMPMFFIVAGYFSKSWTDGKSAKATIRKSFVRLVVPMLVLHGALALWQVLLVFAKGEPWISVLRIFTTALWADVYGPSTLYGPNPLGISWFLMSLFVAKTALLFLSRLRRWALPISLLMAVAAILLHGVFPYSIWCITLGMTAFPFVTLGWWVRQHKVPVWIIVILVLCWPLEYLFVAGPDMYSFLWPCWPVNVLGACGGTYVLYFFSKFLATRTKYVSGLFAYLGMISLAIMCMHGFEIDAHLGSHLCALFGLDLSVWAMYVWRYLLTIALAIALVHIPKIKNIFS